MVIKGCYPFFVSFVCSLFLLGCSGSSFTGESKKVNNKVSNSQDSSQLGSDRNGLGNGLDDSEGTDIETGKISNGLDDSKGSSSLDRAMGKDRIPVDLPETAITKGSFSVYTAPEKPIKSEDYYIHIVVSLSDRILRNYSKSDLSGTILGTDQFRYQIGSNTYRNLFHGHKSSGAKDIESFRFDPQKKRAKLVVRIPGASRLIKDTIHITSALLGESQEISIIFNQ